MNKIVSGLIGAIAGTAAVAGLAYAAPENRARRGMLRDRIRDKASPLGWE